MVPTVARLWVERRGKWDPLLPGGCQRWHLPYFFPAEAKSLSPSKNQPDCFMKLGWVNPWLCSGLSKKAVAPRVGNPRRNLEESTAVEHFWGEAVTVVFK